MPLDHDEGSSAEDATLLQYLTYWRCEDYNPEFVAKEITRRFIRPPMSNPDVSAMNELANVRLTLAGSDIGSLPDDFSTLKLAEARMEDLTSARDEYQELKSQKDRIEAKERDRLKAEGLREAQLFTDAWPVGAQVAKKAGASWRGKVVGYYSTQLTPRGYAIESDFEPGSVQIYPETALVRADALSPKKEV